MVEEEGEAVILGDWTKSTVRRGVLGEGEDWEEWWWVRRERRREEEVMVRRGLDRREGGGESMDGRRFCVLMWLLEL